MKCHIYTSNKMHNPRDNQAIHLFAFVNKCKSKAPAKRSQHANATYRNNVGRNMLRAFGHRVLMCCDMLGVVGSNLTKFDHGQI